MDELLVYRKRLGYFPLVGQQWGECLNSRSFRIQFYGTMCYGTVLVVFLNFFFNYIQGRTGTVLHDPILSLFRPINLSGPIFTVLYCCALIGIRNLLTVPRQLLRGMEAMAITYTLRIITLYFVRLDPPAGMVALSDPFILHFAYSGKVITKDLFFSGHTTSMLVLVLATRRRFLRYLFLAGLLSVIFMLLWARVHYTIDILGAVICTLAVWKLTGLWWKEKSEDPEMDGSGERE